jgi:cytochrome c553
MKKIFLGIAISIIMAPVSYASGDAVAGKAKAGICAACHGGNGISVIPNYPNLAGQKEAYILSSLKAYKAGLRKGGQAPVMQGQAMALSDTDMVNLAAYFSSL